jgi:hypothetical protein
MLLRIIFFFRNTDTHTHTITHLYEHTHTHLIFMNTSERLIRLDLKIYEVGLTVDGDIVFH